MTLRRFPGAIVLGLLASLFAHAALFGNDHAMGGAYSQTLAQTAIAGCAGLLAFLAALAWLGAKHAADGSVLVRRMATALPSLPAVVAAAGGWFVLGERIEPDHGAAPILLTVLALAAAAWVVRRLVEAVAGLLADAVIAVNSSLFAPRAPYWSRRAAPVPLLRRSPLLRRRFARPPPIASLGARI